MMWPMKYVVGNLSDNDHTNYCVTAMVRQVAFISPTVTCNGLFLLSSRDNNYHQYFNVDRCESVRVCVTDVTSLLQCVLWERVS